MMMYDEQWKQYVAHPQLLLARANCREEMRKQLKSMTKENVRKKRNQMGQMSHSQPLIVCEVMRDQVQEYESMIDICNYWLARMRVYIRIVCIYIYIYVYIYIHICICIIQ